MKRNEIATTIREIQLKSIGIKAREFRKKHRYTQSQIANKLCMSARQISLFEQGKNDSAYILYNYVVMGLEL